MKYDTTCSVYRNTMTLGTHNRPTKGTAQLIGTYECRVSNKTYSDSANQQRPQLVVTHNYTLFLPFNANIRSGDTVAVNGVQYNVEDVYSPGNHHIEARISILREV